METVTVTGTAGTFALTYNGQTTTPLAFNATPSAVAAALNALSSISGVNGFVTVTQIANVYYIGFGGQLTGFNLSPMSAAGSGSATATVATSNVGAGATTVASGASLVLQGGISVGGKPLMVQGTGSATASTLQDQWFNVGPTTIAGTATNGLIAGSGSVAGRVTSVAVDPTDPNVIYIATGGGGAWKTINDGQTWIQLFDGNSNTYTGAIAVAQAIRVLFTWAPGRRTTPRIPTTAPASTSPPIRAIPGTCSSIRPRKTKILSMDRAFQRSSSTPRNRA